jgi:hypothetical protein
MGLFRRTAPVSTASSVPHVAYTPAENEFSQFLWHEIVPNIDLGYLLVAPRTADVAAGWLFKTLRATTLRAEELASGSSGLYILHRENRVYDSNFSWDATVVAMESASEAALLFYAPGGRENMAALSVDLKDLKQRSVRRDLNGVLYVLSKGHVATPSGAIDMSFPTERDSAIETHDSGRVLTSFCPTVLSALP